MVHKLMKTDWKSQRSRCLFIYKCDKPHALAVVVPEHPTQRCRLLRRYCIWTLNLNSLTANRYKHKHTHTHRPKCYECTCSHPISFNHAVCLRPMYMCMSYLVSVVWMWTYRTYIQKTTMAPTQKQECTTLEHTLFTLAWTIYIYIYMYVLSISSVHTCIRLKREYTHTMSTLSTVYWRLWVWIPLKGYTCSSPQDIHVHVALMACTCIITLCWDLRVCIKK